MPATTLAPARALPLAAGFAPSASGSLLEIRKTPSVEHPAVSVALLLQTSLVSVLASLSREYLSHTREDHYEYANESLTDTVQLSHLHERCSVLSIITSVELRSGELHKR